MDERTASLRQQRLVRNSSMKPNVPCTMHAWLRCVLAMAGGTIKATEEPWELLSSLIRSPTLQHNGYKLMQDPAAIEPNGPYQEPNLQ